jgi:hypothetical protein
MTRSTRRRQQRSDPWPLVAVVLGAVLVALLGLVALTLLGGGSDDGSPTPSPVASPTDGASVSPSPTAAASASPGPVSPSPDSSPGPSAQPSAPASPSPDGSASPSPDVDPVTLCTGSDENRDFFRSAAAQLPFGVYCGSVPGWTLTSGSFRGSDGGRLLVAYQRAGGASLILREGNFCGDEPACLPEGTDLGPARFGDLEGRLLATDGGYAVVVEARERLAYVLEAIGVGEDGTRSYAEALVLVP